METASNWYETGYNPALLPIVLHNIWRTNCDCWSARLLLHCSDLGWPKDVGCSWTPSSGWCWGSQRWTQTQEYGTVGARWHTRTSIAENASQNCIDHNNKVPTRGLTCCFWQKKMFLHSSAEEIENVNLVIFWPHLFLVYVLISDAAVQILLLRRFK